MSRLRAASAVRTADAGRVYLDERAYRGYRRRRVLRVLVAFVMAVAVILSIKLL
jgi:hypothetical protein